MADQDGSEAHAQLDVGDNAGADPNMLVGEAPLDGRTVSPLLPLQSGSETADGTDPQKGQKRKGPTSKDAIYRAKKKVAQQKVEEEKNDLKAKNEELERENIQLKWEKSGLEKQVLELKVEVQRVIAEKERAVADKERAVAEKEKFEKEYVQRELTMTTNLVHEQDKELLGYRTRLGLPMAGSRTSGSPPKLTQIWLTFLIHQSMKLPSLQYREEFPNPISSSIMSLFKYTTTKIDAKRRLAVGRDDSETDFHVWNLYGLRSCRLLVVKRRLVLRIKKFRTLRSHFDPPNGRGDWFILVKNSARSVWRFRCATQGTRKPVIVGDLVDDQIVFYEGDVPTEAHYRNEIAIVGLGLATWVELEFSD